MTDQVERLAGPSARQSLDELRRMTELLEEAGLIRKDGDRYELTPRGIRKIGQRSLEEIFATLKKDAFGGHRSKSRGRGGDPGRIRGRACAGRRRSTSGRRR